MAGSIKLTKVYDHPVESLWAALTSAEAMSEWLMPCNMVPEIGNKFQFTTKPGPGFDGIVHCEILELVENEKLSFSWKGGKLDTVVSFRLKKEGDACRLDFAHTGFEGLLNNLIVKRILANGWKKKILVQLLPEFLQR